MSVNMAKGFCLQLLWSRGKSFWLQGGRESMLIAERTCCCGTRSNYKTKAEGAKAEKAAKPIRETQTQIDHRIPPQKTKMTTPQIGISKLLSDSTTPNLSWYKSLHIPPFSTLPHHMPPWQIVQCCVAAREGISQGKELGCIEGIGEKRCSHWHLQCKKIVSKARQRVGTCPTCRKSHQLHLHQAWTLGLVSLWDVWYLKAWKELLKKQKTAQNCDFITFGPSCKSSQDPGNHRWLGSRMAAPCSKDIHTLSLLTWDTH